jgi:hypothetical protein
VQKPGELVFVVRMWRQKGAAESGPWRGFVQEIESGRRFYIVDTHDVLEFIRARMAEASC